MSTEFFGTVDDLAEMFGISARRVQQLEKESIVVKVRHGEYDIKRSVKNYLQIKDSKTAIIGQDGELLNKAEADLRKVLAETEKLELANAVTKRDFIHREVLGDLWSDSATYTSKMLLSFPGVIKREHPEIPQTIIESLDKCISQILNKWVKDFSDAL